MSEAGVNGVEMSWRVRQFDDVRVFIIGKVGIQYIEIVVYLPILALLK